MASYTIQIDWNNDGDFSDANEDISEYVIEAVWSTGYAKPYDHAAAPGWLKLTLDNTDRRFSPENASSPLYSSLKPMRYVRIQATYNSTTHTLFYGYLWRIEPEAGQRDDRQAIVHCIDAVALLEHYPLEIELLEDKRSDEVLDTIIQRVAWPPALSGYWVLGIEGHMELGQTTRLSGASVYKSFETGRETFAYAGDTWYPENTTALEAIRQTCASEYGRFHFTRAGKARFLDRHWVQKTHTVAATFNDDVVELIYRKGTDALHNEIVVHMNPRVEGTAGSVLWSNEGDPVRLAANSQRTIRAVFVDDGGRRHGASTLITPVASTDYIANSAKDGSGETLINDARLSVVSVEAKATGAAITFQWGQVDGAGTEALGPVYLTKLQLRGTPLKAFDPNEIAASDAESITRYQRRRRIVDAALLNDPVTGYAMARYLLMLHKDPVTSVEQITLCGDAHLADILTRTLFDVVKITETQTALSNEEHFIIAEHHKLNGTRHTCTWRLEALPPFKSWLLGTSGRSELGQNTWLGF